MPLRLLAGRVTARVCRIAAPDAFQHHGEHGLKGFRTRGDAVDTLRRPGEGWSMTAIRPQHPVSGHGDGAPEAPAPDAILRIATGFMSARHLFVAAELGLFAALADGPRDLDELASVTEVPRRTARITADAMVALGLVERGEH